MVQLTNIFLKRPISALVVIAALFIFGLKSLTGLQLKLMPDMDLPILLISTSYPQASPEDVEKLVSKPIEDACGSLTGLNYIQSYSQESVSMVMLRYNYGTDVDIAYMKLQEKMEEVKGQLPEDAKDPMILAIDVNAQACMTLSVNASSAAEARDYAENTLSDYIEKVSGVSQVDIAGGSEDYISIRLMPELLKQYGLTISSVADTVGKANFTLPAGSADYGNQEIKMSGTAEYKRPADIKNIPITTKSGDIIHLSDIATVSFAAKDPDNYSRYNGVDNVTVNIKKDQTASSVTVSARVQSILEDVTAKYPNYTIDIMYDEADSILNGITEIGKTLALGVVCTMLVIFLFFGDIKGSLIVGSSMPVSLLLTFLAMNFAGFSLDMVTMGSLIIAIGMMVDNSIVVIEMCFQKLDEGLSFHDAAYEATKLVMNSVIASTITTVVVYVPLARMESMAGQLFGPLGWTIVFAMIASLLCAVTVVPLCFAVYKPTEKKESHINHLLARISESYGAALSKILNKKILVSIFSLLLLVATFFMAQGLNSELMGGNNSDRIGIKATFRPGTRIENVDLKIRELEKFVADSEYVEKYSTEVSDGSGTVNAYIKDDVDLMSDQICDIWNEALVSYADNCKIDVSASGGMMGNAGGGGAGSYETDFESRDLDLLKAALVEMGDVIANVNGVISVSSSLGDASTKAKIVVDPMKADIYGLTPSGVSSTLYKMIEGTKAEEVTIDNTTYEVRVEYPKGQFENINDIQGIILEGSKGQDVMLSDIAEIVYTDSPQTITKQDGWYRGAITAKMNSETRFETQKKIDAAVKAHGLPASVSLTVNSTQKSQNEEFGNIFSAIGTAVILVYMVMAFEFESLRYSGMIMFCIPFALFGSIGLLLVTNTTISMTSLMGFLMLIGIVVNNGILYVDYTNVLRKEGHHTAEALVLTGQSRLRPILMTTLTTILSMLPMALGLGGKNAESMRAMSYVIIGGLIASTLLTLFLLPTFYLIIHQLGIRRKKAKAQA